MRRIVAVLKVMVVVMVVVGDGTTVEAGKARESQDYQNGKWGVGRGELGNWTGVRERESLI